ncbi:MULTISPECIES: hypothetical protein [Bacillus]|uniref:hypothetical protein n=1 Tax=Bacillus TaxID=1386 RepID=UPI000BB8C31E|nr:MULTISPECIES: hypothetical protein [Bacillus]
MSQFFDKEFKALQSISRSEEKKIYSFYEINKKKRIEEKSKSSWNRNLLLPLTSLLAILIITIFAGTNLLQKSAQLSEDHFMHGISSSQIMNTFAAPSENINSFKARQQEGMPLTGVRRYEPSSQWHILLVEAFSNAEATSVTINDNPHIDFLIQLEGKRPLQLKLWLYPDGTGYIRQHGSSEIYQLKEGNVIQLIIAFNDLISMEG